MTEETFWSTTPKKFMTLLKVYKYFMTGKKDQSEATQFIDQIAGW